MNRTGLVIALSIGVVVGVVFGVVPRLDLAVSTPFYDPKTHDFPLNAHVWSQYARTAARALITLLIVPAGIALLGKFLFPRRRMLIKGQAVLFLIATLAVGPGLLTNTLLKDRILFGSDYPVITPDRWLSDFDKLQIKPEVRPKVLKENAVRLLKLAG